MWQLVGWERRTIWRGVPNSIHWFGGGVSVSNADSHCTSTNPFPQDGKGTDSAGCGLGAQVLPSGSHTLHGDRQGRKGSRKGGGKIVYRSEVAAQVVQPAEPLPAGFAGIGPFSRVAPEVALQVRFPLHHMSAKRALEPHLRQVICKEESGPLRRHKTLSCPAGRRGVWGPVQTTTNACSCPGSHAHPSPLRMQGGDAWKQCKEGANSIRNRLPFSNSAAERRGFVCASKDGRLLQNNEDPNQNFPNLLA